MGEKVHAFKPVSRHHISNTKNIKVEHLPLLVFFVDVTDRGPLLDFTNSNFSSSTENRSSSFIPILFCCYRVWNASDSPDTKATATARGQRHLGQRETRDPTTGKLRTRWLDAQKSAGFIRFARIIADDFLLLVWSDAHVTFCIFFNRLVVSNSLRPSVSEQCT